MKLWIGADELYPVYSLCEAKMGRDIQVELSDADYAEYRRVEEAWEDWQDKIYALKVVNGPLSRVVSRESYERAAERISKELRK